jgi:hypothetical protein
LLSPSTKPQPGDDLGEHDVVCPFHRRLIRDARWPVHMDNGLLVFTAPA